MSKTAKILANYFNHIDKIIDAKYEDLINVKDIGTIIGRSIEDYFNNDDNLKLIEDLKSLGLNMKNLNVVEINDNFSGKTFVLTGSLEKVTREEAKSLIEKNGGNVSGSVSKKTDVVVVGDSPGSKYDKAKELGITIWNEEEFLSKFD